MKSNTFSIPLCEHDPKLYLDQLLTVREAYSAGQVSDHPKSYDTFLQVVGLGVSGFLLFLIATQTNWLIAATTVAYLAIRFVSFLKQDTKKTEYEEEIIAAHLAAGFSRANATEFIYDIDWDDIQYGEDSLNHLRKKAENA